MDLSVKDIAKKTALLRVSENGDTQTLARLMECGMRQELLGPMLAIAGHYGRVGFIKYVVSNYNVDPQSKDEAGKSAYLRAGEQGQVDVLKYMFTKNLHFDETDVRRRNILHSVADGAEKEVMEFVVGQLKKKGANIVAMISAKDRYIGGELCMLIRGKDKGRDSWHYVEVIRGLFDVFMKRTRGGTIDVAKYGTLLNSGWGADPDEGAQKEIEKRFESRRSATVNEDLDVTPLHIAAFKDKFDIAKILLENGSEVNVRDKFGLTPLHIAAMRGNLDLIKLLLKFGAKTDWLDSLVKTAADVAEDNEHRDVANYLKSLSYLPVSENFCRTVLPNIQQLLSTDHIQALHESGSDVRAHMVNTLRDLTVSINEALLALGSGPVHEESSNT
jgi:ankyrin repeat protein